MAIPADGVAFTPHHQNHLGVHLEAQQAVDHVNAFALHGSRPFDVAFLIEARLQFHDHRHLLAVLYGFKQRLDNGRVAAQPIQRHLDGQDVRIARGAPQKFHHRLKRLVRMMQQLVLLADQIEDVVFLGHEARRGIRQERLVLQIRTIQAQQVAQAAEVQRPVYAINIRRIQLQLAGQKFDHRLRRVRVHLQTHRVAKTTLPHSLLDGFKQIVRFQFLDGDFGVASEMKDVSPQNLQARKQMLQIGDDQLLQPNKTVFAGRSAGVGRKRYRKQLGQSIGNLHASEVFRTAGLAHRHRDIQAKVRNVRKRPARIERQRSENRKYFFGEERIQLRALFQAEVRQVQQANLVGFERRNQIFLEKLIGPANQGPHHAANSFQSLRRTAAIQAGFLDAVFDLLRQARHAHHEELVEVGPEDRKEFDAL